MTDREAYFCLSFILWAMAIFMGALAFDNSNDILWTLISMFIPLISGLIMFMVGLYTK